MVFFFDALLSIGFNLFTAMIAAHKGSNTGAVTGLVRAFTNLGIMAWAGLLLWGDKL